jgi:hypothetical protein
MVHRHEWEFDVIKYLGESLKQFHTVDRSLGLPSSGNLSRKKQNLNTD